MTGEVRLPPKDSELRGSSQNREFLDNLTERKRVILDKLYSDVSRHEWPSVISCCVELHEIDVALATMTELNVPV